MYAFLNRLETRKYYLLLGGTALLIIAAAISLLLLPQFREYKTELKTRADLPPIPVDSALMQSMLSERDTQIAERAQQLHGDMANLPIREIEAFVIDRLQGIAWNHNVSLQGVRPSVGDTIESFREILFKLELIGQYADLYGWLHELRGELGFIVIKEYQMDVLNNDTDNPTLKVLLTIASYRKEAL